MAYAVWTNKDLEKYKKYVENITFEQVGVINITGIYSKQEPYRERSCTGYVFRVYDGNVNCPDRARVINNPGAVMDSDGSCRGLALAVSKDSKTGSFVQVTDSNIANPAAIWIRRHYTGNIRVIADYVVGGHEKQLHENYCTHHPDTHAPAPVLTEEHIDKYILPPAIKGLADEIAKQDAIRESRKAREADEKFIKEYIKSLQK